MIDLYVWPTPNGYKISIMLEETETPYRVFPVDIAAGDQFKADFLKISPNNKMPAIVDSEGPDGEPISIFESGAILLYLAEKTGRFMPRDMRGRYQVHHFRAYAPEPIKYAIDRYTNEATRIYNVIDRRLGEVPYLAGDYSIADMATYPWLRGYERQGQKLEDYPNLKRWYDAIEQRPAVQRGLKLLEERRRPVAAMDDKARDILFGASQYAKR
jgi:GST-like protein